MPPQRVARVLERVERHREADGGGGGGAAPPAVERRRGAHELVDVGPHVRRRHDGAAVAEAAARRGAEAEVAADDAHADAAVRRARAGEHSVGGGLREEGEVAGGLEAAAVERERYAYDLSASGPRRRPAAHHCRRRRAAGELGTEKLGADGLATIPRLEAAGQGGVEAPDHRARQPGAADGHDGATGGGALERRERAGERKVREGGGGALIAVLIAALVVVRAVEGHAERERAAADGEARGEAERADHVGVGAVATAGADAEAPPRLRRPAGQRHRVDEQRAIEPHAQPRRRLVTHLYRREANAAQRRRAAAATAKPPLAKQRAPKRDGNALAPAATARARCARAE